MRGRSSTADLPPTLIRHQQVRGSSPRAGSNFLHILCTFRLARPAHDNQLRANLRANHYEYYERVRVIAAGITILRRRVERRMY